MRRSLALLAALALPRISTAQTTVDYALTVDSADLSGYAVEMRIHHAPATMRLAMAAHPEYDDRFWRYVRNLTVETAGGEALVARADSMLWDVRTTGGETTVRYRIELPPPPPGARPSWRPFLSPTGGHVGGPHSFMYVIGHEDAPGTLALRLPPGWRAATSLESGPAPGTYHVPDFATLMDSPVLIGRLREWHFSVAGVPHEVAYWPKPDAAPFDTAGLVSAVRGIVEQAHRVFGTFPYRRFVFLMHDGAYGGLEHASSVDLGVPSEELAGDRSDVLLSTAHEYFHAWNEVRLRPAGWGGLTWRPPGRTRELWWTEGVTMYFADLLLRRAGLVSTPRLDALREKMSTYLDNPASALVSPEQASWTTDDPPGANGDLQPDLHLAGEMVAIALDLRIRGATHGRRGLDDAMRLLYARRAGRGFTGADVERAVADACGCPVHDFFERHVRGHQPVDLAPALRVLSLRATAVLEPAVDSAGRPRPDLRVWAYDAAGEVRLVISDPRGAWARAGLHTNDVVTALDGAPVAGRRAFLTAVRALRVGDRVRVDVMRAGRPVRADVYVGGYARTRVMIDDLPRVGPGQLRARTEWMAAR